LKGYTERIPAPASGQEMSDCRAY